MTLSVPTTSGQMPNFGISETGCQIEADSSYPGHSCENNIFDERDLGADGAAVEERRRLLAR